MLKKRNSFIAAAIFLLLIIGKYSSAQNFHEDSQVYTVGTLPHSCTHIPYPDVESALKGSFEASSYYKSLNGNWAFNWVPKPDEKPVDFFKPDFVDTAWNQIPVPSCWEHHGYGNLIMDHFLQI